MSPLHSDWSHAGLKGLIPSVLHYSLLGYNFFIPDAVGKDGFFPFTLYFCLLCNELQPFSRHGRYILHLRGASGRLGAFCFPVFCCAGLIGMNATREKSEELKPKESAVNIARPAPAAAGSLGMPFPTFHPCQAWFGLNPTWHSEDLHPQAPGWGMDVPKTPAALLQVCISAPKQNGWRNPEIKTS